MTEFEGKQSFYIINLLIVLFYILMNIMSLYLYPITYGNLHLHSHHNNTTFDTQSHSFSLSSWPIHALAWRTQFWAECLAVRIVARGRGATRTFRQATLHNVTSKTICSTPMALFISFNRHIIWRVWIWLNWLQWPYGSHNKPFKVALD